MCEIGWQTARTAESVCCIRSSRSRATFGPSSYARFPNACCKHSLLPLQSSIFLSSGSNVNFFASPEPAAVATNRETSPISSSLSLPLKAGMPPPPFRTWRSTRCSLGRSSSRLGPVVPVAPAALSVWQFSQPASAKTFAPPSGATPVCVPPSSPPPQPGTRASAIRAVTQNHRTACIQADGAAGTLPAWEYDRSSGRDRRDEARPAHPARGFPDPRPVDPRQASRLPGFGGQLPEAAPGARRDPRFLRDVIRQRAPRRLHALRALDGGLRRRPQQG